jgi:hypothetical protein
MLKNLELLEYGRLLGAGALVHTGYSLGQVGGFAQNAGFTSKSQFYTNMPGDYYKIRYYN